MPLRAVIFDFGNVLCPARNPEDFQDLWTVSGIEKSRFLEYFWRHRLEYDSGALDAPAYWRKIGADAGVTFNPAQIAKLFDADTQVWLNLDPSLLQWAQTLRKAGLKAGVLSNMPRDIGERLKNALSLPKLFDALTLSGELVLLKPGPDIYWKCLADLRVRPQEALFIDDRDENVEGGRAVGMHAVKFESVEKLARDIEAFGLPALARK